ncbi:MAG TPA: alpha/beta hydrolase [Hyphomicrobiaceae bacterium]|nr:alpha/beta hydrolase [Hyphomicrobiaceae bacterium]
MGQVSPAAINIIVLAVALLLYGLVWYATRNMSRFAQVLARLSPVGLVIPAMVYVSALTSNMVVKEAAKPSQRPIVESSEKGGPIPRTAPETEPEHKPAGPARPEAGPAQKTEEPAAPEREAQSKHPEAKQTDWDIVPVFYGTDRDRSDQTNRVAYGTARAQRMELGRALVTVPKLHQVPNIERPFAIRVPFFQITIFEQAEDARRHFTIQQISALSREEFIALARQRVGGSNAFKDQALIFVHGYNTDFDAALYRTAQMAYDLQFDGASFLYSWPSASGLTGYYYDRESATQAERFLRPFIDLVVRETGAQSVSLIAHSMGNLPLLQVLRDLGPTLPAGVQLNQIILASPDVDRDVFAYLAANLSKYGRGITLYCSANDRAMAAARRVAGGIPRAGDVPDDGPIVIDGIDTIDISATSTDTLALNHSIYAERTALLNDIGLLLQTGERPPDRRIPILQRVTTSNGGAFWRYPVIR